MTHPTKGEQPRFYVQSETIRGEPRVHWVCDRSSRNRRGKDSSASECTTDRRQAQRWCDALNAKSSGPALTRGEES